MPFTMRISTVAALLLAFLPHPADADPAVEAARAWRQAHGAEILSNFAEFLTYPNVAADTENIWRTAEYIRDGLASRGVEARLLDLDDRSVPPIVYGRLDSPGATRTLAIYVHYDGQPVDAAAWTHDPWKATLYTRAMEDGGEPRPLPGPGEAIDPEWRLYARSAADDKAPIPAIWTALDALKAADLRPTSNIVFFFEGEEEAGSNHLGDYLQRYRDLLDVDGWLICDGPSHQSGRPQLVFGVRGYSGLEITTYGAIRHLHSGHYGNWAPNPAMMLSRLLATMVDDEGVVKVKGFHDGAAPITDADRRAMASVPDYDDQLRKELGIVRSADGNAPMLERLLLTTLNVKGLSSATVGEQARNLVPATATASVDMRLAKGITPDMAADRLEGHIAAQGYHIVRQDPDLETRLTHPKIAKVVREPGYPGVRTSSDLPMATDVARAMERAATEPLVLMPTLGGSLPLYLFEEHLGQPLVVVPFANHDNKQHGPDENLRVANLWLGIDLMAALFTME